MKGIILAGGNGTRLAPVTSIINKSLVPVINIPMILYPIETLKSLSCNEVLIVTGGNHMGDLANFLGDGSDFGINLTYKVQKEAGGIAQALSLAREFTGEQNIAVILGDNYFEDKITIEDIKGPTIFTKEVDSPERFGVFHNNLIIEKPKNPKSSSAVTGLYIYDSTVFDFIETLKPSERNELEITDVNNWYLKRNKMDVISLKYFWSDMGTPDSLLKTSIYIKNKKI